MSRQVQAHLDNCWTCTGVSCDGCVNYSNWKPMNPLSTTSDGSTASYYELPANATQLQHLISAKNMNAQIGEIFRACYRYGQVEHSPCLRDAKKIKFYIEAEIARLEKL